MTIVFYNMITVVSVHDCLLTSVIPFIQIREKSGDLTGAMRVLKEAREGLGAAEVQLSAKFCAQLAEYASVVREYDTAIVYYKRALQCRPGDTRLEIALAKLYMQVSVFILRTAFRGFSLGILPISVILPAKCVIPKRL